MKYGYMFYQKPIIPEMPSRPVNLGDPIQSYAVQLLYKEMGIKEEDIIPVPRYDLKNYDGEECICTINTCSTYEELAYDSYFMPPSSKIHAVPTSIHINREFLEGELDFYRSCGSVGCRDSFTEEYLREYGIRTYLSGCLTITLPRRTKAQHEKADKVYFMNVPADFKEIIPDEIKSQAIELSNIERFDITHAGNRMTVEEAEAFHKSAEARIKLLRDTAKLVITSRLHVATPCLAMGIPVILTNHDDRFGFVDRFLPSYTQEYWNEIEWNPQPVDIEREKDIIKQDFFARIRSLEKEIELRNMWNKLKPLQEQSYKPLAVSAIETVRFPSKDFQYAILGTVSTPSYFAQSEIKRLYPEAQLVCGIDSYVKNKFCGEKTIKPSQIVELPEGVVIIATVPGAYKSAEKFLGDRPHVIMKGNKVICRNM